MLPVCNSESRLGNAFNRRCISLSLNCPFFFLFIWKAFFQTRLQPSTPSRQNQALWVPFLLVFLSSLVSGNKPVCRCFFYLLSDVSDRFSLSLTPHPFSLSSWPPYLPSPPPSAFVNQKLLLLCLIYICFTSPNAYRVFAVLYLTGKWNTVELIQCFGLAPWDSSISTVEIMQHVRNMQTYMQKVVSLHRDMGNIF